MTKIASIQSLSYWTISNGNAKETWSPEGKEILFQQSVSDKSPEAISRVLSDLKQQGKKDELVYILYNDKLTVYAK